MPRKVFDAMSMGKPIVASTVADLPQVLEGCGYLTPAGDVDAISSVLKSIVDCPEAAEEIGRKAREKCLHEYSAAQGKERLRSIVREICRT